MRTALLACVLSLWPVAPGSAGPFEDGTSAFERGDYATALRLWRPLAEQGNARAQYNLAQMYLQGEGVPQDAAVAMEWYRKAADQGMANAQSDLGTMYILGQGGLPQDVTMAVALEWYRRAAEQGLAEAQYNLGWMYDKGRGVPQDYAVAAEWYRKAADQGMARAQINLGAMYILGQGGLRLNYVLAHMWFNLAASHYPTSEAKWRDLAAELREEIATRMTPTQIAEAQRMAREWKPKKMSRRFPARM